MHALLALLRREQGFRLESGQAGAERARFLEIVRRWMSGQSFLEIARTLQMEMDNLLAVRKRAITFTLQMLVEQGLSLLARLLQAEGPELTAGTSNFTQQLRFGEPNVAARLLAEWGVRHRHAYVRLGTTITRQAPIPDFANLKASARASLRQDPGGWDAYLD